jgi:regulator of cell morphogenesis and NO signaling
LEITADTLVADIAAYHPRSLEVSERHGIDFCCGGRHPELPELARVYRDLQSELEPHLAAEEERVFPAVRRLAEPGTPAEDVQGALHALEEEHDRVGAALARLRALSRGFTIPDDACTTYRALFEGLLRFERELHEHVHLENNVLFPRVISLQAHAADPGNPTERAR